MKKFLRILSPSTAQIPSALDQRILAAAALRANSFKRKRRQRRIFLSTAAAAVFIVAVGISFYAAIPNSPNVNVKKVSESRNSSELLALADLTALEQGNYNTFAALAEVEFSEENFLM